MDAGRDGARMQGTRTYWFTPKHLKRRWQTAAMLALGVPVATLLATAATAEPAGSRVAKESLVLCDDADDLSGDDQWATLVRGVQLAEDAIAADGRDAKAHFALFCNLGKQTKLSGLGLSSLFKFRRLRRELDTTLTLAPDDPDALAAQGALLVQTPRLFGGDAAEGERLLRRALDIEPNNTAARRYLAEALRERGADSEAQALLASSVGGHASNSR